MASDLESPVVETGAAYHGHYSYRVASRANGTCSDSHAIKIGRDLLAYPPTNTRYPTVQPTACYATLADATADGHRPAPGTPPRTP
jgi:hypothetical protein